MEKEKRMAGEYEIIHAVYIGAREVVVGARPDGTFLCGFCVENELFSRYTENVTSKDYLEIMGIFAQRVTGQIEAAQAERKTVHIPLDPIQKGQCFPLDETSNFMGQVVAVKPDSLRYEYRRIDRQLVYVDGGSGARKDARGSAVFGINLFTGKRAGRWERWDIMGVVRPEHIPDWAKTRLQMIAREQALTQKDRGESR